MEVRVEDFDDDSDDGGSGDDFDEDEDDDDSGYGERLGPDFGSSLSPLVRQGAPPLPRVPVAPPPPAGADFDEDEDEDWDVDPSQPVRWTGPGGVLRPHSDADWGARELDE